MTIMRLKWNLNWVESLGMESLRLLQRQVAGSYTYSSETWGNIKCRELIE